MQQIAQWLKNIGLSEYAQCFAENAIDVSVLQHLTDQDLKDIGVLLGHRRRMLAAIAELRSATTPLAEPVTRSEPKSQDMAERRQVTVMFSDMVGSTALSTRMDPEDLREIISAYQECVTGIVRRFDGFVAKYMGDGVLVYFGYPEAHEDDAERAARAGLELIAAVAALATRAPLQTRVGIATGLVVVGDLIGSGSAQEHGIVGETPNLAARLQGVAEPNMVVIAEYAKAARQSLRSGRSWRKGSQRHRRAGAGLGGAPCQYSGSRFEALYSGGTSLVGREKKSSPQAPLAIGEGGRGLRGIALGRGWYRQIAACGCAHRAASVRTPCHPSIFLLAPSAGQCLVSRDRPPGTGRGV